MTDSTGDRAEPMALPTADEAEDMTVEDRITALIRAGYSFEVHTDGAFGSGQVAVTIRPYPLREIDTPLMAWEDTLSEALLMAWPDVEGDDGKE